MPSPRPTDITLNRAEKSLTVVFDSGETFVLPAEYLRVFSPSAEVQGHSPEERKTITGKRTVGLVGLEAVGHYAVQLVFDDQHDSGIFTWDYLYDLGKNHEAHWAFYLSDLEDKGLDRDTPDFSALGKGSCATKGHAH